MGHTWILVSGKRYAGKDTVADMIAADIPFSVRDSFARVAKTRFARKYGLDETRLLTDIAYKEQHRVALIEYACAELV